MKNKKANVLKFFIVSLLFVAFSHKASAGCPEGQYEACLFGACLCMPNSGTVIQNVPVPGPSLPDILIIGDAVVRGDVNALNQSIGRAVISSACVGCEALGNQILSQNDKAFVERVVGRGFILLAVGVDPSIVFADAATSVARQYFLRPQQPPTTSVIVPPTSRTTPTYSAEEAACAVVNANREVVIGWVEAPDFVLGTTPVGTFPDVDLLPGDVIHFSSRQCADLDVAGVNQTAVTSGRMYYARMSIIPGKGPNRMRFFMYGSLIAN